MKSNKIYEDNSLIVKRSKFTFRIIEFLLVVLLLFFWKIQILEHNKYWQMSEANRIREVAIPCQRGLIRDRNGIVLADNRASFKALIIRENIKNPQRSYTKISHLLDLKLEELKRRINKYKSLPSFQPVVVKEDLALEEVSMIESRKTEMPELMVQAEPKRYYPFGSLASHVLGYLQEISKQELESGKYEGKIGGDLVGKQGIEKQYESYLAGKKGRIFEIVDSVGRKKGEIVRKSPQKGEDISLTLDFDLQQKAENLLQGKEGAVIVLDPSNGEVLALASYPDFDPNKFINRFTPEQWRELVKDPDFPLQNRAIRGLYAPGSVFKPVIALGALDLDLITPDTQYYCSGLTHIYNHPFSCWYKPGHGWLNLYQGIQNSCNIYFYNTGKKLGIENIAHYAKLLGFGKKTGIDLPGEKKGLVPDPKWKQQSRNEPWYPGETISVAIGQGPLMVTPLQVANYTALIANRGVKVRPHLLKRNDILRQTTTNYIHANPDSFDINEADFNKVIQGMWKVVNEGGTGASAKVEDFNVCGKTGSTQVISSENIKIMEEKGVKVKTHSWFTGFAPQRDPQVVVTLLVEYGGMGGGTAAPLARELFKLYKQKYVR